MNPESSLVPCRFTCVLGSPFPAVTVGDAAVLVVEHDVVVDTVDVNVTVGTSEVGWSLAIKLLSSLLGSYGGGASFGVIFAIF